MRAFKPVFWLASALLLVAVTGILAGVRAQERTGDGENGLGGGMNNMSGQQKLAWIEAKTEAARGIVSKVQAMLDQARKDKDILRITCINDKLTQIRVNIGGIEERTLALRLAVDSGDPTVANHQFEILRIYISRVQGLKAEAENCLGEVDVVLGATETEVTIDDSITEEDPSDDEIPDIAIDQVIQASGFF